MKYSLKITGIALITLLSVIPAYAQDESSRGMYGPGTGTYGPGGMMGGVGGHRSFKVADVNLDQVNEIILLQGNTLTVMDNTGETLFTKTVNGVYTYSSMSGGSGTLEVANLDDDAYPEIIIGTYSQLIVLDHNGDPKTTITLPTTYIYPWRQ